MELPVMGFTAFVTTILVAVVSAEVKQSSEQSGIAVIKSVNNRYAGATVDLGIMLYLRIITFLDPNRTPSSTKLYPVATYPDLCWVESCADETERIDIIVNSCPAETHFKPNGFTKGRQAASHMWWSETGAFPLMTFVKSPDCVVFKCILRYCYEDGSDMCLNTQNHCNSPRKKRSSLSSATLNVSTVQFVEPGYSRYRSRPSKLNGTDETPACYKEPAYMAPLIGQGSLLLMMTVLCGFLVYSVRQADG